VVAGINAEVMPGQWEFQIVLLGLLNALMFCSNCHLGIIQTVSLLSEACVVWWQESMLR